MLAPPLRLICLALLVLGSLLSIVGCGSQSQGGQGGDSTTQLPASVSTASSATANPADACGRFGEIITAAAAAAGHPWTWSPTPEDDSLAENADSQTFICQGFLHSPSSAVEPEADNAIQASVTVSPTSAGAAEECPPYGHLADLEGLDELEERVGGAVGACGGIDAHSLLAEDQHWTAGITADGDSTPNQGAAFLNDQTKQQMAVDWLLAIDFNGKSIPEAPDRASSQAEPTEHLTDAEADALLAEEPCELVPAVVVERSLEVRVAANPLNLGCDYVGNEGSLELNSSIAFSKRSASGEKYLKELAAMPGSQGAPAGELGVISPPQETGPKATTIGVSFVDARYLVLVGITYDHRSARFGRDPAADNALLIRYGDEIEAALSR
jgi:hypothetical protein